MGGKPRNFGQKPKRPSPLQQVHLNRPLSTLPPPPPTASLPASPIDAISITTTEPDPQFWKRFSIAVHKSEAQNDALSDEEKGVWRKGSQSSSIESDDHWLAEQEKEKRNCHRLCAAITVAIVVVGVAAGVVGWYFTQAKSKSKAT